MIADRPVAVIQRSHTHFWDSLKCMNMYQAVCIVEATSYKYAFKHHISLSTLNWRIEIVKWPIKLEMSQWNKIEGTIWHIEKKVIPIPELVISLIQIVWYQYPKNLFIFISPENWTQTYTISPVFYTTSPTSSWHYQPNHMSVVVLINIVTICNQNDLAIWTYRRVARRTQMLPHHFAIEKKNERERERAQPIESIIWFKNTTIECPLIH